MQDSTSESLLIRLSDASDADAWSRFVQLYTPLIFFWARKTGLQPHDAADLVQDVLTIVFQKLPELKYDPAKSFRGWLRTVTLNRFRELCRKQKLKEIDGPQSALGQVADPQSAESTWDLNYARQLVAAAMGGLKGDFAPPTWTALNQLIKTGQPAADIARETGVSVWTLYAAKARLMRKLRTELSGLLD